MIMFLRLLKEWPKTSYMKQLTLMKCSLASAPVEVQQMQFSFLDSFMRSISQNTENCILAFVDLEKAFD